MSSIGTKGPSNLYRSKTGKTGYEYAKDFIRDKLATHADQHHTAMGLEKGDLGGYLDQALYFANDIRTTTDSFVDAQGSTYKYDYVTNEFAIISKDGYVVTYFKPSQGVLYWTRQLEKHDPNR